MHTSSMQGLLKPCTPCLANHPAHHPHYHMQLCRRLRPAVTAHADPPVLHLLPCCSNPGCFPHPPSLLPQVCRWLGRPAAADAGGPAAARRHAHGAPLLAPGCLFGQADCLRCILRMALFRRPCACHLCCCTFNIAPSSTSNLLPRRPSCRDFCQQLRASAYNRSPSSLLPCVATTCRP